MTHAFDSTTSSESDKVDVELGTNVVPVNELKELDFGPGMWQLPTNCDLCCIYRVPNCMRRENPEAYTPQMVLIGPLHHVLKPQAPKSRGDITNTNFMSYLNMEAHKKFYLKEFAKRFEGKQTIEGFKRVIEEEEVLIRASYSESTAWIESSEFVEMILHDSVFILEFILRTFSDRGSEKTGDHLVDEPCLKSVINKDLSMLENQLPYFILEKLFAPIIQRLHQNQTLREFVITHFGYKDMIEDNVNFKHFTDLIRCVHIKTVPESHLGDTMCMKRMYNADKLDNAGVKFRAVGDGLSLYVRFENGYLKIPCFFADEVEELILRNMMALEQCHYPYNAYICNYVKFLDYLIDTDKDVNLLVEKGIIPDWSGHHRSVAKMVNSLCLGVVEVGSIYTGIAEKVNHHCDCKFNKLRANLKRVYFSNLWVATATIVATCLLLMTLGQTATSIMQVLPKNTPP